MKQDLIGFCGQPDSMGVAIIDGESWLCIIDVARFAHRSRDAVAAAAKKAGLPMKCAMVKGHSTRFLRVGDAEFLLDRLRYAAFLYLNSKRSARQRWGFELRRMEHAKFCASVWPGQKFEKVYERVP